MKLVKRLEILVLMKNLLVGKDILQQLSAQGFNTVALKKDLSGAELYLQKTPANLIILDVSGGSVFQNSKKLDFIKQFSSTPKIFLTSSSNAESILKLMTLNPFGILIKPFSNAKLMNCLDLALQRMHRGIRHYPRPIRQTSEFPFGAKTLPFGS